jgi:hypothetical protein
MGPRQSKEHEEVLVEDITDRPDSGREKEEANVVEAGTSTVGHKIKVHDAMDIIVPYLPDPVTSVDDMLRKVLKLIYADHDVHDVTMFPKLVEENYLINTGEIGPLGKPIPGPEQWITRLYNSGIMNLLDV